MEVVDYYPFCFKEEYAQFSLSRQKGKPLKSKIAYIIRHLLALRNKKKRCKAFNDFLNSLPLTKQQYNELTTPPEGFDALFFGSDQIWNPLLTKGKDKIFCGNFEKNNCKFISYAASTNPQILNDEYREYFTGIVKRFNSISIRENSLCNYLNTISPSCSRVVLDPVLLLSKDDWSKIAIKPKEENYLLIYTVPQSNKVWEMARMIAKEKGLRIVEIRPYAEPGNSKNIMRHASPQQFIGYFKHASYIVTTSFHGTAFSLKFEKEFVTLKFGSAVDDRANNLLKSVGIEERMVSIGSLQIPNKEINYSVVTPKLEEQIEISNKFIVESL